MPQAGWRRFVLEDFEGIFASQSLIPFLASARHMGLSSNLSPTARGNATYESEHHSAIINTRRYLSGLEVGQRATFGNYVGKPICVSEKY